MPTPGGSADKLGNRYEALWTIDQLLELVDGRALWLELEPIDPDESKGIEFRLEKQNGSIEYWSSKRQTTKAAGWTLNRLTEKNEAGRSILGDLLGHIERSPKHYGVFASTLGAGDFEELRSCASDALLFEERLKRNLSLAGNFNKKLLPLCKGDRDRARSLLQRVEARTADEKTLREGIHSAIRTSFCKLDGSTLDVESIRLILGDFLLDNLHKPIDRDALLLKLKAKGVGWREWASEKAVQDQIARLCEKYTGPLRAQRINGKLLELPGSERILDAEGKPTKAKVLVVGGAGGGKSTTLGGVVEKMRKDGIPVLPIRFDEIPDGICSTRELGHKMLLPESPLMVLAGIAEGRAAALVVDQLDAVSMVSGRRTELWTLFDDLRREAERFPNISLIVGCRAFDLEHDHRMRVMKTEPSGFEEVKLASLSKEQIDKEVREAGTNPATVQASLKSVLDIPLHLWMFVSLPLEKRHGLGSRDELFDSVWQDREDRTTQRLARPVAWTKVIDTLSTWLSENQKLLAPPHILDDVRIDARAMASEHVLIYSEDGYRFFHETFFDYAFARRFAAKGGRLVDLLLKDEQHLFRRAQVRQILAYIRTHDRSRYLKELESILKNENIRFHIKRLIFQWMSSITDPELREWNVLQGLLEKLPDLRSHVYCVVAASVHWFDILDKARFFDIALSQGDEFQERTVVWMFRFHAIMKERSARVAELMGKHYKPSVKWTQYLRDICQSGDVYHSREMFEFFLGLGDEGIVSIWGFHHHGMNKERPDWMCEALGRWFDHTVATWRTLPPSAGEPEDPMASHERQLSTHLDQRGGLGKDAIEAAKKAPKVYAQEMLPRIAQLVEEFAVEHGDYLHHDPIWSYRSFGDNGFLLAQGLLSALAIALEDLAKTQRAELDTLIAPYKDRPHDTIAYLLLRAWTANPEIYADTLAEYLAADPLRLKIGYTFSRIGGVSATAYTSVSALRSASARCSDPCFKALESTIVGFKHKREARRPQNRGRRQLELMHALEKSRLSEIGRAKLEELERKFPGITHTPMPPETIEARRISSPIAEDKQAMMSDKQWLGALEKYAGLGITIGQGSHLSGGEEELARSLEKQAQKAPVRFAALAEQMPDDFPSTYFDAILSGVQENISSPERAISLEQLCTLILRVHGLPQRPCGRAIAWLIEKCREQDWPVEVMDAVAWYAIHDPDPDKELWSAEAEERTVYFGGDPFTAGINSVRGAMARVIAQLLFEKPERFERLEEAIRALVYDRSIAVRSCTIKALTALLKINENQAIAWCIDCVGTEASLLGIRMVEHFIYYAGHRNYTSIYPIIDRMLTCSNLKAVEAGARQVCVLALSAKAPDADLERVLKGSSVMRKAAVDVLVQNIAGKTAGARCRHLLKPIFKDEDPDVCAAAASAFRDVASLETAEQADLLEAFLDSNPGAEALEPVVLALLHSPVQLPDLVCRLAEICIKPLQNEANDISKHSSSIAVDLSKIVIRLYQQSEDDAIRSRCLNLIDEMERHQFLGLSDELKQLDR